MKTLRELGARPRKELDAQRRALLEAIGRGDVAGVQATLEAGAGVAAVQLVGRLSRVEVLLRQFDADGDGVLCCAEFVAYCKAAAVKAALTLPVTLPTWARAWAPSVFSIACRTSATPAAAAPAWRELRSCATVISLPA